MPWWGKSPDKDAKDAPKDVPKPSPAEAKEPERPKEFDPDKLPDREKLPPGLQKIVDESYKNDNFYDELVSG